MYITTQVHNLVITILWAYMNSWVWIVPLSKTGYERDVVNLLHLNRFSWVKVDVQQATIVKWKVQARVEFQPATFLIQSPTHYYWHLHKLIKFHHNTESERWQFQAQDWNAEKNAWIAPQTFSTSFDINSYSTVAFVFSMYHQWHSFSTETY